ncbi:unnamed protein product [Hyaloperonospora brassicae]|uniref:Uncharacterized protein n=1 Tax=Hyaloperonospora brassicae TaxID=162125 RepID=A0AAV0UYJ6_HYABA|nr:unnamed protein product [Hyaloperonospora brassicae]
MPTSIVAMEDSLAFASHFGPDSFESTSLLELHTAWMDNEELNQLPLYMDVEADDPMPKAPSLSTCSPHTAAVEKPSEQSLVLESGLTMELDDLDTQLLDAALELSFDTELSPILEPFAATSAATSLLKKPRRRSKNAHALCQTTSSSVKQNAMDAATQQVSKLESSKTRKETAVTTARPRTRSSSWQQHEQNTFFALFKLKWPPTRQGERAPSFSSLLLQRFDAISTKIRTKNVMEVRQFYTTVMQNIATMLRSVDNDVDLTNPDQVRIALWCWSKLIADKKYCDEFLAFDSATVLVQTNLANVLLQSIIRSRRQMLKAKSEKSTLTSDAPAPGQQPSISAWVSRSNLSSYAAGADDTAPPSSSVQIHYPMVRKKHSASLDQVASLACASSASIPQNGQEVRSLPTMRQASSESAGGSTLKRKRSVSMTCSPVIRKRRDVVKATAFTSPSPVDKRSRSRMQSEVAFHTPRQLSQKKMYMKMRMVPQDKRTKAHVVRGGYRPKVELKLSSTKRISEITAHMSKKWAKVRPWLPKEAVLCFFEKKGVGKWSKEDPDVTCFDIWKRSGKRTNDENVVDVSYVWMVPETDVGEDGYTPVHELVTLEAPPELFEVAVSATSNQGVSSSDESDIVHFYSTCGLPEFGDEVHQIAAEGEEEALNPGALAKDSCDKDRSKKLMSTSGRSRRRIKPVLVSKEEFDI